MEETYGQMIARLRGARGWTQKQLADESRVPLRTLQDVELDKVRNPQRATKIALHSALNIEGDAEETRRGLSPDTKAYVDVLGTLLEAMSPAEREEYMHDLITNYAERRNHPNGQ